MGQEALTGGFADPPRAAAVAFRAIMGAMARPGSIHSVKGAVAPAPVSPAAAVVLATLCDPETGLWLDPSLDSPALRDWLAFHTGAPVVGALDAVFALGRWEVFDLEAFSKGTPEYPDRSATLIVELDRLEPEGAVLTGPGIETRAQLSLPDVAAFQANRALFPRGLDFIFTCGDRVAALPRSTQVQPCMSR